LNVIDQGLAEHLLGIVTGGGDIRDCREQRL
jgi:hypothetical protein